MRKRLDAVALGAGAAVALAALALHLVGPGVGRWGLAATVGGAAGLLVAGVGLGVARRERRRAARAAAASLPPELAASLLESVQDAVLLWDARGHIVHASPSAERMFGCPARELLGAPLRRLLDPQAHRELERAVERFRRTGELRRAGRPLAVPCRRSDGGAFTAEVVVTRLRSEGSARFVGVLRDVSERRRAREVERRSESLRILMDHLPDAIRVQRDGELLYANRRFLDFVGRTRAEEVVGQPVRRFLHPDDREAAAARERALAGLEKALEMGEQRLLRPDGSLSRTESVGVPLDFDGEPAVAVIARDLDERARADALFRMAVESSPNGMVMVDAQGRIVLLNREAERLFGYVREELLGRPVETLVPERFHAEHPAYRQRYLEAPETRQMGAGRDLYGLRKDGTEIPIEIGLNPIETEEGCFVLSAVVDIRERVELRDRLRASDRLASVGTLAAGVAHGINNPLAYVTANLSFVRDELPGLVERAGSAGDASQLAEARTALDQAEEGAARIRGLVTDLLTFARGGEGRLEPVDLRAVLESVLNMMRTEIRHRARLETDWGEVPRVAGEESKLAHAFMNVVANAAQSIPEGQASGNRIRVATRRAGPDEVRVEVRDTGTGIDEAHRAHVFEPFYTTKSVGRGTGLGLSVAHGILAGLGGWIDFVPGPEGRGTTFRIGLPVFAETLLDEGEPPAAPRAEGARLLVVDDEPSVLAALRRLLGRVYSVTLAQNAREALAALERERFDAILLDLMMPETTGIELYGRLERERPETAERVLFMTGGAFTDGARRFLEGRDERTLRKPFAPEDLRRALQRVGVS